jgi:hypothetical protein
MAGKPKILLVGDRAPQRDEVARALVRRELDVRPASTFELRFAAAGEQPDLVVLDVGPLHPDDLARLLGDAAPACPVLLHGDRSERELRELAHAVQATVFVTGDGTPESLADEVERRLREGPPRSQAERPVDYLALARRSTRSEFLAACAFPFLLSSANLVPGGGPTTAGVLDNDLLRAMEEATRPPSRRSGDLGGRIDTPQKVTVLAVRQTVRRPDETITVGRERGVDILIDHATVSKKHASFAPVPGGLRVSDAGSRNGTWVAGRLLAPRGAPSPLIESGDVVRVGELEFSFLSPSSAWDRLRVTAR